MEVELFLVALCLLGPWCAVDSGKPSDLNVLILSPYPNEPTESLHTEVGWAGGPALFPAAELAADLINNRTDILPDNTLRLINADSGCEFTTRASVTFAREAAFNFYNEVIGIVGPACSPAAIEIGGITTRQYADVVSITIANGPLLPTTSLTNMFRLLSSAGLSAHALLKLLQKNGWTSILTVADSASIFFLSIYSRFREIIAAYPIKAPLFDIEDKMLLFNSVRNTYNVIYVFAGSTESRKLLCLALKLNFVYPDYQWIFVEVPPSRLLSVVKVSYNGKYYTCTENEMKKAVDRIILLNFRLIPEIRTVKTDVGLSYNDFLTEYEPYHQKHVSQIQNITDGLVTLLESAKKWAATYFDSIWALGLALNRTAQVMKGKNMTLSSKKQNGISSIIRNELLSINFSGITGQIYFHNETLEVPSITIDILQMNSADVVKIGYYYEEKLFVTDPENASFVDPIKRELVTIRVELAAIFFPIAIIIFLIFGIFHLIFLIFRNYKSIRAQSPHFIHMVFSGCYLYIISSLLDTIRAANWTQFQDIESSQFVVTIGTLCNVVGWCLSLSTMLIFGTMCTLSWRIYRIFTHYLNPGKSISDPFLVGVIVALLTINVSVLVAWSAHDPLLPRFIVTSEGLRSGIVPVYARCDCEHLSLWFLSWLLNELVIVLVVTLAILNRNVPKKDYFNNTKSHSAMVYTISFLNGICIPIYFILLSVDHIDAAYVVFQLFTLGSPACVCICLLVPPVIPLFINVKQTLNRKITTMTTLLT